MKKLVKHLVDILVRNNAFWSLCKPILDNPVRHIDIRRGVFYPQEYSSTAVNDELVAKVINEKIEDLVVRNGPFKGMRYPRATSMCSTIFPKLLGSYERELDEIVESICGKEYSNIIDIGCAEGYYAVGLAMRVKSARVFAYDIDESAAEQCANMAKINGVSDRVTVSGLFDPAIEKEKLQKGKVLVVSDCEGAEKHLFTSTNRDLYRGCELLIETHDFIDIDISSMLKETFSSSHKIISISSLDDIQKIDKYSYPEILEYSRSEQRVLLAERRPAIMEWLYLTPK